MQLSFSFMRLTQDIVTSTNFKPRLQLICSITVANSKAETADKLPGQPYTRAAKENKNVFVIFHASRNKNIKPFR